MTTNHFSKLDPALIRPGRVDVQEFLDDAVGEQAERLYTKFYGTTGAAGEADALRDAAREVRLMVDEERAQGKTVSMASLQGLFIRSDAKQSLVELKELCKARAAVD